MNAVPSSPEGARGAPYEAEGGYTLFIHSGTEVFVAVLQPTKSGQAVFLKSFRRSNQQDADRSLKKTQREGGSVVKDEF
jgi:hypothetical protein